MLAGIGIDLCDVAESRHLWEGEAGEVFMASVFTDAELAESREKPDPAEHLAACFAAKEAAFKAVAHLLPEKTFDLRIVETLTSSDGSPAISCDGAFGKVLSQAGLSRVLVSLTHESGMACAVVAVE